MGEPIGIRVAEPGDLRRIVEVLDVAFGWDPVSRWLVLGEPNESPWHRALFRAFTEWTIRYGVAHVTSPDLDAAALWLDLDPDAAEPVPGLAGLLRAALGPVYGRFARLAELTEAVHPRQRRHAYLPFIGVLPEVQGYGLGTALLRHHLDALDEQGLPAYLEASSRRAMVLYHSLGFRRTGHTVHLPPTGPALFPMWREPAPRPSTRDSDPARASGPAHAGGPDPRGRGPRGGWRDR